jgi:hypothetical protein
MSDPLQFVEIDELEVCELTSLADSRGRSVLAILLISDQGRRYWLLGPGATVPDRDALETTMVMQIVSSAAEPPLEPSVVVRNGRLVGAWLRESLLDGVGLADFESDDEPRARRRSRERSHGPAEIADVESRAEDLRDQPTRRTDQAIRRTPHLDAPRSIPTAPRSTFDVSVRLDKSPFRAEETGDAFVLEVPPDLSSVRIGVLITTSAQFDVTGEMFQSLVVERDRDQAGLAIFTIKVTEAREPSVAGITALLVYNGHSCGSVTRRWSWDPDQPHAQALVATEETGDATIALNAKPADLSVFITRPINDGIHFCCAVQSPLLEAYKQPTVAEEWALPETAASFVTSRLRRIVEGADNEERRRALLAAGVDFYDAAPPLFKKVLWEVIDADEAPCSIYIASSEPALPWELMVPSRSREDGVIEDRRPLGVEFPIGRWTRGDAKSPSPQQIEVNRSFVIAPRYHLHEPLDPTGELRFLSAELAGLRIDPASERDLECRFKHDSAELIHFVCHGASSGEEDYLYLDDDKELHASTVRILEGFKALCGSSRPLVFINACEAGALTPTIGGLGGFPKALGDIGARAIIAPLWSVRDSTAGTVAVEIYRRALATPAPSLGEVIRGIRARAYNSDDVDDSFAAYCLFGDPMATLSRAKSEAGIQGATNH